MLGFLLGVVVGAAGYWGYRFWKGDDTSWEQSFPPATGSSGYGGLSGSGNGGSGSQVGGGSSPTAMGGGVSGGTGSGSTATAEGARTTPE